MNKSMTVLYLKHTGHVLGAMTLNPFPEKKISAKDLGGTIFKASYIFGLPSKFNGDTPIYFNSEELETAVVPYKKEVLANPYEWWIRKKQGNPEEILNVSPGLQTAQDVEKVILAKNKDSDGNELIEIILENEVTEDTNVWASIVRISPHTEPISPVYGTIKKDAAGMDAKKTIKLPLQSPLDSSPQYHILVFVSGRHRFFPKGNESSPGPFVKALSKGGDFQVPTP